jgi:beta-lactamase class A
LLIVAGAQGRSQVRCTALLAPADGQAFFGLVQAPGPRVRRRTRVLVNGQVVWRGRSRGRLALRLHRRPGQVDVVVRYARAGCASARDAWLLPRAAKRARRERGRNAAEARRLAVLGHSYPGWAGLWVHDLSTGRVAGWNADAAFPAASIVKLGVLVAALRQFGAHPRNPVVAREISDLAVRSSNLASNRLILRIGGSEQSGAAIVQETLRRLGATSSTFTGFYRIGNSVRSDAPHPLPLLAYRRTTAHDAGRILFELHAATLGNRLSLRRTGLSREEAGVALGLLLSSSVDGPDVGLFRRALPRRVPAAQKNGWTTAVRHTAAIVYGRRGPVIVVVLTYRPDIDAAASQALAERVIRSIGF